MNGLKWPTVQGENEQNQTKILLQLDEENFGIQSQILSMMVERIIPSEEIATITHSNISQKLVLLLQKLVKIIKKKKSYEMKKINVFKQKMEEIKLKTKEEIEKLVSKNKKLEFQLHRQKRQKSRDIQEILEINNQYKNLMNKQHHLVQQIRMQHDKKQKRLKSIMENQNKSARDLLLEKELQVITEKLKQKDQKINELTKQNIKITQEKNSVEQQIVQFFYQLSALETDLNKAHENAKQKENIVNQMKNKIKEKTFFQEQLVQFSFKFAAQEMENQLKIHSMKEKDHEIQQLKQILKQKIKYQEEIIQLNYKLSAFEKDLQFSKEDRQKMTLIITQTLKNTQISSAPSLEDEVKILKNQLEETSIILRQKDENLIAITKINSQTAQQNNYLQVRNQELVIRNESLEQQIKQANEEIEERSMIIQSLKITGNEQKDIYQEKITELSTRKESLEQELKIVAQKMEESQETIQKLSIQSRLSTREESPVAQLSPTKKKKRENLFLNFYLFDDS